MSDTTTHILTLITSLILGLITAYPGLRGLKAQQKERQAHAKAVEDEITERVINRAKLEIEELTNKIEELKADMAEMEKAYDEKIERMEKSYNEKIECIEKENEQLRRTNQSLTRRVRELENKNKEK